MTDFTKQAQKRSLWNVVKEKTDIMEGLRRKRSPEYARIMQELVRADNHMREKAKQNKNNMRDAIHDARMAMKNHEYPQVIYHAWRLLNITDNVISDMTKLEQIRDKQFKKFYGKSLNPTQKSKLYEGLMGRAAAPAPKKLLTANTPRPELVTEAGMMQWLKEILPTKRELQGNVLDRIFRNRISKQREGARDVLQEAESIYRGIKDLFGRLDNARNDFNQYMETVSSWKENYNDFKTTLTVLYKEYFDDLIPEEVKAADPVQEFEAIPTNEIKPNEAVEGENVEAVESQDDIEKEPESVVAPVSESPQPVTQNEPTLDEYPSELTDDPELDEAAFGTEDPGDLYAEENMASSASYVVAETNVYTLITRAKKAFNSGEKGIAVALLTKASEVADDNGAEDVSVLLLKEALRISKE